MLHDYECLYSVYILCMTHSIYHRIQLLIKCVVLKVKQQKRTFISYWSTALLHSQLQPVQCRLSTQGWQALSLLVWKYIGTNQQPQTCGPSCTALTGRMGHLQWETQQTHMGPWQVWRQWLSMQWPSLPSLTAHCVQSSLSTSLLTQLRVSAILSVHCGKVYMPQYLWG